MASDNSYLAGLLNLSSQAGLNKAHQHDSPLRHDVIDVVLQSGKWQPLVRSHLHPSPPLKAAQVGYLQNSTSRLSTAGDQVTLGH